MPGPSGRLAAPGFVGRGAELRALAAVVESARRGRGRAMLVIGDAGVGKTRLVEEATSGADDVLVLEGGCLPLSTLTVPLLPLKTALAACPMGDRSLLEEAAGGSAQAAERFDAWLVEQCEQWPVVLAVDDLQWADPATLDVLMWVISGLTMRRLAVLLTLRRGEVGVGHPLQRWLADVRRLPGFAEIVLHPLDLEETREQLAAVLGEVPHDDLTRQVFARSAGNSYLNRLLVAGLPASATDLGGTSLSDDLSTAVLRSWHTLSAAARELARVIAVGARVARGRDLDHAALLAGVQDAAALLRECVDAELLDPQPGDGYWFHHPLQAEALEAGLAPAERERLHSAFAALLEAEVEGTGAPDLPTALLIADHHHRAGAVEAAYDWSLRAADAAESVGNDVEATRLLLRALGLGETGVGPGPSLSPMRSDTHLLDRLRVSAARAGEFAAELTAVEAILSRPDLEPLVRSELLVRRQHLRLSTAAGFLDPSEMQRAVDLSAHAPTSWQHAFALAEYAHAALWAEDPRAQAVAAESVAVARVAGNPRALAHALAAATMAGVLEDRSEETATLAPEAVAAAARAEDGWAFVHAALWEANSLDTPAGPRWADVVRARRRQLEGLGLPHPFVAWLATDEGGSRLYAGNWQACRDLLRTALGARPGRMVEVKTRLYAARMAAQQGRPREARGHLARADELAAETSTLLALDFDAVRALVLLSDGDLRGAVEAALAGTATPGMPPTMCEWLLPLAARALADLVEQAADQSLDAQPLRAELEDLVRRFPHTIADTGGTTQTYLDELAALDALYLAEVARGLGDDDCVTRWATATDLLGQARLRWEECYAGWRHADALFRSGLSERATAVKSLRRSHALAVRLQAGSDLAQILALARSARVRLDEPDHVPVDPTNAAGVALTARESEVLAHVVAGRTYREIAAALFVTEKTVSSHVSHLLAKTGCSNRVELARWAARRPAPPGEGRGLPD